MMTEHGTFWDFPNGHKQVSVAVKTFSVSLVFSKE